tara:strand:- start:113 stop:742 length:630 start_codon:yes stop_codon:yes gene_type:complete
MIKGWGLNKTIFRIIFSIGATVYCSGGYDHGLSAGKGNLDLDLTWNPFQAVEFGQSYIVWGYGLSSDIDFHGYYSTGSSNNPQIYSGLMMQFFGGKSLNLSTAIGLRKFLKESKSHIFFPQLLYYYRLTKNLHIGGSFVNLNGKSLPKKIPITIDTIILYRIWPNDSLFIFDYFNNFDKIKSVNLGLGLFYNANRNLYPTYSFDLKFSL